MPSSTSSSEIRHPDITREVPARSWLGMAAVALTLNMLALGAWELHVRSLGYQPDIDDAPSVWAEQRKRARGATREQLVLVGSSRTLFDLDLDVLQAENAGVRPIQLATVGSNPSVILHHLAEDESYAGTTLVGVVPGLFAVPAGPPVEKPKSFVKKYESWSLADGWEQALSIPLQQRLAFMQQEDLTLRMLTDNIRLPNRQGARVAPQLPPHFSHMDLDRRTRTSARVESDAAFREHIQQIWLPLFTPPPPPPIFSQEQWAKLFADGWSAILAQTRKDVEAIERRGGRVFFVRDPSSGPLRELEDKFAPRHSHWDRLLRETGAPGVYDQDYPELAAFECPEWSHLSAGDSVLYTQRLVRVLRREGVWPERAREPQASR